MTFKILQIKVSKLKLKDDDDVTLFKHPFQNSVATLTISQWLPLRVFVFNFFSSLSSFYLFLSPYIRSHTYLGIFLIYSRFMSSLRRIGLIYFWKTRLFVSSWPKFSNFCFLQLMKSNTKAKQQVLWLFKYWKI